MQKTFAAVVCCLMLFAIAVVLPAYDARLASLNDPTLSLDAVFPTNEFGYGVSAVPDQLDIWHFPQALADLSLFPTHTFILDLESSTDGNGGIVLVGEKLPLALGIFLMRPNRNGWVTGEVRGQFPGLGANFPVDANNAITTDGTPPDPPVNIIDVFIAAHLGLVRVGAGVGHSALKTLDSNANETKQESWADILPLRGGVGIDLKLPVPITIEIGTIHLLSNYHATYSSGAAGVPIADADASISADNYTFGIDGRVTLGIAQMLDLLLLAEYAYLPQDYSATDNNGDALDSSTTRIAPAQVKAFAGGMGVNWWPGEFSFINTLVYIAVENANWYFDAPPITPTPENNDWGLRLALRAVIGGEFQISPKFVIRGGFGGTISSYDASYGGSDSKFGEAESSGSLGIGFSPSSAAEIDLALNLANLAQTGGLQSLSIDASIRILL